MADRETMLVLTASDEAIFESRHLAKRLTPPALPGEISLPVMYIRADEPSYVDEDSDLLTVEGPVELESDSSVHGRACLPSYSWEEDCG